MLDLNSVKIIARLLNVALKKFNQVYKIDGHGIWANYKGDEICWLWPHRDGRNQLMDGTTARFFSMSFMGYFKTLRELDLFWDQYWKDTYTEEGRLKGVENVHSKESN